MYRPPQQMVLLPGYTPMQVAGRGRGRGKPRGGKSRGGKKKNKNTVVAAAQPTTATTNVAPTPLMALPERNAPPEPAQPVDAQPDEAAIMEETSQSFMSSTEAAEDTIDVSEDFSGEAWQIISEETDSPVMKEEELEFVSDTLLSSDLFSQQSAGEDVLLQQPESAVDNEPDYQEDIIDVKVEEPLSTNEEEVIAFEETVVKEPPSAVEHPLPNETEKTTEGTSSTSTPKRITISPPKGTNKETSTKPKPLKCEICRVFVYQEQHMKQHLSGRKHKMNLEAKGMKVDKLAKAYFGDTQQSNGKEKMNEKMSEQKRRYLAYSKSAMTVPGISDAMQEFLRHPEPLIGLKYAIEVGKTVDDPNPVYHCSICDDHFNSVIKIKHFTNPRHRKAVLKAEFPERWVEIQRRLGDREDPEAYRAAAMEIETVTGRQVHLIHRKVVTTGPIGERQLLSRRERRIRGLLEAPQTLQKDYLLDNPNLGPGRGPVALESPHDRVVRVVPGSMKRGREPRTWSPPPAAKRLGVDPRELRAMDDLRYAVGLDAREPPLRSPLQRLGAVQDGGPPPLPRQPLLPPREEPPRAFAPPPKPLLSMDLPPLRPEVVGRPPPAPGPPAGPPRMMPIKEQLRRMLDTMDSQPLDVLIRNEEDASMALHISNNLTKALLHFRMHTTPHGDRGELGSVYSMFSRR